MRRCLLIGALVTVVACSARERSLRRLWQAGSGMLRHPVTRDASDYYYHGGSLSPVSRAGYQVMHKRPRPKPKPRPTRAPFKFKFDVDLVTLINYLLLPLLPLLLSMGRRVTSSTATVTSTGADTGTDQILDYDTGETVTSVNTNIDSVVEDNSQVITESVINSPVTTETNEETNDDNDIITNP